MDEGTISVFTLLGEFKAFSLVNILQYFARQVRQIVGCRKCEPKEHYKLQEHYGVYFKQRAGIMPSMIMSDNGTEFKGEFSELWCKEHTTFIVSQQSSQLLYYARQLAITITILVLLVLLLLLLRTINSTIGYNCLAITAYCY